MTETIVTVTATIDPAETKALATRTADALSRGKMKITDVWAALLGTPTSEVKRVDRTPPPTLPLTAEQTKALKDLPRVYAVVEPETDRALTSDEAIRLLDERECIDVLLALLTKRKAEGIRETIAMHLDHVLEDTLSEDDLKNLRLDDKGHYQIKQDVSVPGTGKKMQKTVSSPKPVLSMDKVQAAHDAGEIDRETYLAITSMPEVPRVLDEAKLVKAIKKNPDLLWSLAKYTTTGNPITTIKVEKDT